MFTTVLIANRGAVARRIIRTLRAMGLRSVAVYSEADRDLPHVAEADEAHCIGSPPARASYLDIDRLVSVARQSGADAVHPGYGFLAENAAFARAVSAAGMRFIGPSPVHMERLGHKQRARHELAAAGMPVAPGSPVLPDELEAALAVAERSAGFPMMLKPAGGGGGIGMVACIDAAAFRQGFDRARRTAQAAFAAPQLYAESLLMRPRHIEFQILGDGRTVRHLFERDCSTQRRHQKLIEESPAPALDTGLLDEAADRACAALAALGYDNIGTVEMLYGADGRLGFLEVNTRLQVEHAVTEAVTGIDLVAAQLRLAAGEAVDRVIGDVRRDGHALEVRVYAEDPVRFLPSPGVLSVFRPPETAPGLRVETGYREGNTVTPYYDPLLAKVIVHAPTRVQAIERMLAAIAAFEVAGLRTNLPTLAAVLSSEAFRAGRVHTGLLEDIRTAS